LVLSAVLFFNNGRPITPCAVTITVPVVARAGSLAVAIPLDRRSAKDGIVVDEIAEDRQRRRFGPPYREFDGVPNAEAHPEV